MSTRFMSLAFQYGHCLRRRTIASLKPNALHVAPSLGMIASSIARFSPISSIDTC